MNQWRQTVVKHFNAANKSKANQRVRRIKSSQSSVFYSKLPMCGNLRLQGRHCYALINVLKLERDVDKKEPNEIRVVYDLSEEASAVSLVPLSVSRFIRNSWFLLPRGRQDIRTNISSSSGSQRWDDFTVPDAVNTANNVGGPPSQTAPPLATKSSTSSRRAVQEHVFASSRSLRCLAVCYLFVFNLLHLLSDIVHVNYVIMLDWEWNAGFKRTFWAGIHGADADQWPGGFVLFSWAAF